MTERPAYPPIPTPARVTRKERDSHKRKRYDAALEADLMKLRDMESSLSGDEDEQDPAPAHNAYDESYYSQTANSNDDETLNQLLKHLREMVTNNLNLLTINSPPKLASSVL